MQTYMPNHKKRLSVGMQTRYNQVDEIQFAVNSVLKYASFVRCIFIVTDHQIPDFLREKNTKYNKVKIIDHKVIFKGFESSLPTFSSRSIETLLHKIPNLSEHFLYCNDDFFFVNKVKIHDFFKDNRVIIRGKWLTLDEYNPLKKIARKFKAKKRGGHKLAQQKAASILGFKRYFKFHHTPQAFRKSTIETFFKDNANLLKKNISYRFRDKEQFIVQKTRIIIINILNLITLLNHRQAYSKHNFFL